jgi:imidazoleglycerol phosphate synthase glutamine amidotransferase subunit HisH
VTEVYFVESQLASKVFSVKKFERDPHLTYMVAPQNPILILAQYRYEGLVGNAAIAQDNVTGLQFHPKCSGPHGLKILKQFIKN